LRNQKLSGALKCFSGVNQTEILLLKNGFDF